MASKLLWNPEGYNRFANERTIPPLDLLTRVIPSIPIKCIVVRKSVSSFPSLFCLVIEKKRKKKGTWVRSRQHDPDVA